MESLTHSEIFWWCLRFFVHSLAKVYMCSLFEVSSVVSHNVIKERRMSHTLWESHGITSCHCAKLNWIITAGNINGILSLQPAATSVFWPSPKTQIQSLVGPARVRMPESWTWRVEMFLCWSCGRIGALNSHRLNDDVWVVAAARLERGQRSPLSRGSVFTKKPHWGAQGNSDDLLLPMSHAVCVREREGLVSEWPLTLCYYKSNVWVFVSRQFV